MIQLFSRSPGLLISVLLLVGCAVVCLVVGALMKRMGASRRPLLWFAGFFLLVVLPQVAGHLWLALDGMHAEAPRLAALSQLATGTDDATRRTAAQTLLGPDADPALVTDARAVFGEMLATAELAQFAILPLGETVLLARFRGYSAAEKGWVGYLRVTGLNQLQGEGDSQRGFLVTRPAGDKVYALHLQNMVGVWTGPDDASIRRRMEAGGFQVPRRAPLARSTRGPVIGGEPSGAGPKPGWTSALAGRWGAGAVVTGFLGYLFLVVLYFFKGAAWAASKPPRPGVPRLHAADLAARLDAINALEVPFQIERGTGPGEFFATWRYADARWVDLARVGRLFRTFRIRIRFDEPTGVAHATDYAAQFDGTAGRGGATVEWKASLGITFFEIQHQRVFGLQFDETGRPKTDLSYAYTFKLDEMKSPLIEVVTGAGWKWRPTVWQGPTWLRWLTE